MILVNLSSLWVVVTKNCPGGKGCSSDNKLGVVQFEYGLVTDRVGWPGATQVVAGSAGNPAFFIRFVELVRTRFRTRISPWRVRPRDAQLARGVTVSSREVA